MINLESNVQSTGSAEGLSQSSTTTGIKDTTLDLLQKQIKHEFFAERLYLFMASWLSYNGYPETAKFFSEHAEEEKKHAMSFVNFVLKRGELALIPGTKTPEIEFEDAGALLRAAVDHEKFITQSIANIYAAALEEGDIIALEIAREFSKEQIEEEQLFISLLKLYELEDTIGIDMEAQMKTFRTKDQHIIGTL